MSQVGWGKNMNDKTDNETKKEAVENAGEALDEIAKSIETGRPPDKEKIKKAEKIGQTLGRGWRKALRLLKKLT